MKRKEKGGEQAEAEDLKEVGGQYATVDRQKWADGPSGSNLEVGHSSRATFQVGSTRNEPIELPDWGTQQPGRCN